MKVAVTIVYDTKDNPWGVMERFITGQWDGMDVLSISAEAVDG